jgi:hypothetical protein
VGEAPLDRRELRGVLRRSVGARAHGFYALSMQQEERVASLRREIEQLVERFNASPETKASAKRSAELLAVKVMEELGPTKAAIASVAQVFIEQGRSIAEVSSYISSVHPAVDRLRDLVVEVCPEPSSTVQVFVGGRNRPFKSYRSELYHRLRIPLFVSDGSALFELKNARLTQSGYDRDRVDLLGPSKFRVKTDERSFELFKIVEEARLSGRVPAGGADLNAVPRKYSISKLPLTRRLLREAGLLQRVNVEYGRLYAQEVIDSCGRSPRKLAEEALVEACTRLVPSHLIRPILTRCHFKHSGMRSLVVMSELAAEWQG